MATFSFLPQKIEFHDLFERATANLLDAARALKALMENFSDVENQVGALTALEQKGDIIVHQVVELTYASLIAPIDHEDSQRLISALDDALDAIEATAVRLLIYRVEQPTELARKFTESIYRAAEELHRAMPRLRHRQQFDELKKHLVEINRLENEADQYLREGLTELARHEDQLFDLIRWKEIYEHLEGTTDRIEDVADVLLRVIIKNA